MTLRGFPLLTIGSILVSFVQCVSLPAIFMAVVWVCAYPVTSEITNRFSIPKTDVTTPIDIYTTLLPDCTYEVPNATF